MIVTYKMYYFWKKILKIQSLTFFLNTLVPNGTLPKKWHLKCHESVHILTGLYDHLKEYKKLFSKELVNSKCLKKLKIKFWENEYITKKVKFSWTNCLYIWDQQKILILLKILLEVAYFFKFFQYRKGALCLISIS